MNWQMCKTIDKRVQRFRGLFLHQARDSARKDSLRTGENVMTKAGDKIINPVTGEDITVMLSAQEAGNRALLWDATIQPGGAVSGAHYHPQLEEVFTVLGGQVTFELAGQQSTPAAGERIVIPAGTEHDWWNSGSGPARVLLEVRPAERFEAMIVELFGMARAGETNDQGMPQPEKRLMEFGQKYADVIVFTGAKRK
jgi:quercetin dioxygenase-like cupin family protein